MKLFALAAFLLLLPTAVSAQNPPAFRSDGGNTMSLAVTATTSRVQIQTATPGAPNVRIFNTGTVPVFVKCGDITVTAAATTAMPIAPGTVEVIGCQSTHIAAITASGTATLYVTSGTGL